MYFATDTSLLVCQEVILLLQLNNTHIHTSTKVAICTLLHDIILWSNLNLEISKILKLSPIAVLMTLLPSDGSADFTEIDPEITTLYHTASLCLCHIVSWIDKKHDRNGSVAKVEIMSRILHRGVIAHKLVTLITNNTLPLDIRVTITNSITTQIAHQNMDEDAVWIDLNVIPGLCCVLNALSEKMRAIADKRYPDQTQLCESQLCTLKAILSTFCKLIRLDGFEPFLRCVAFWEVVNKLSDLLTAQNNKIYVYRKVRSLVDELNALIPVL